ncbi:MAG: hypothetical protein IPN88_17825 [Bacteroidetes bacterium]|nr:hypothetical protein [Bacteroidota bacterium]
MAKIVKEIYKVHYTVEYYHADDRTTESNDFNIIPIIGKSFLDARNEALNHYDEKLSLVDSMFRFYAGESISEDFDLSTIPNDVSLYI